jgi:GTP cyclohydrolase I
MNNLSNENELESLTCLICGKEGFQNLIGHVYNKHGMNSEEYEQETGYKGPFITTKQARKMQAVAYISYQTNPEFADERSRITKESYTEELKKIRSDDAHEQWDSEEGRKKKIDTMKIVAADPKRIENLKKGLKKHFDSLPKSPEKVLREELYKRANSSCENCGITEIELLAKSQKRLHLHHLTYDKIIPEIDDIMLLCPSCHASIHSVLTKGRERYGKVSRIVGELLKALEIDITDENFLETPRRLTSYLLENFLYEDDIELKLEEYASSVFPNHYDGLVLLKDTDIVGMCPHHLLPVFYKVTIAYIPEDLTIGLSKLHRIADVLCKRPMMQETYTIYLTDYLEELLRTKNVAVKVTGKHVCMMARGVKVLDSEVCTAELRGAFMNEASTRSEFYLISSDKK